MQPGIEEVAEHNSVIPFSLGPKTVVHDIGLIQEFKVAVLFSYRPVWTQAVYRNLSSRRSRPIENVLQHLRVMAFARTTRHTKALVE